MTESYSVKAILSAVDNMTPVFSNISNAASKLKGSIQGSTSGADKPVQNLNNTFKETAKAIGAMQIASKAIGAITNSVGDAVNRMDTLNNATRTFTNMGFNSSQITSAMAGLKNSIMGLPTPLDQAVKGVQMIAASTGNLGKSQKVYSALNDAIIGFGGSTADVNNAVIQLSQAFANGKVDGMTWISMMNSNMGPVLNAIAKQMGMTTGQLKDGLSSGKISVKDFQNALVELDQSGGGGLASLHSIAKDATSGIGTSFQNMKTAISRGLANLIQSVSQFMQAISGSSIADIITNIGSGFEKAMNSISVALKAVTPTIKSFFDFMKSSGLGDIFSTLSTGLLTFIGTFLGLLGVVQIISTVKNAFIALDVAMTANPVGAIIAGIIAVVAALTYFFTQTKLGKALWSAFMNWLQSAWQVLASVGSTVWDTVSSAVISCVTTIKTVWNGISTFFSTLWVGITTTASTVWNSLVAIVITVVNSIQTAWSGFSAFMSGLWNGIVAVASGVWNGLVAVISGVWNTIVAVISSAISATQGVISGGFNGARAIVQGAMNAMKGVVSSVWNAIKGVFNAGVGFIKSVVHVDLSAQGRAIMNSFFNGLKSVWNSIKSFISGIAGWIKAHKGPISLDARLLIPAGQAIMQGFNNGLLNGFSNVKQTIAGITGQIERIANDNLASNFTTSINAINTQNSNVISDLRLRTQPSSSMEAKLSQLDQHISDLLTKTNEGINNIDMHPSITLDTMHKMNKWLNNENARIWNGVVSTNPRKEWG